LADHVLTVGNEKNRVVGRSFEEGQIEMVGARRVSCIGENPGKHAGDGVVVGVLVVELLDEGKRIGLVFTDEYSGELGGERRIVGRLGKGVAKEGFGFGILLASNEQMYEIGGGGSGAGVFCEETAVGGFGSVRLICVFGDVGCEEGVGICLRGDLESFEQLGGGLSGIVLAVDAGEGAPGLGLGGGAGVAGIELRCIDELRAGVFEVVLACQQESKGEMGFKGVGVGDDGAAIEGGGFIDVVEVIGDVAGIEEGARVSGVGGQPGI
jgi:hypothetical protein